MGKKRITFWVTGIALAAIGSAFIATSRAGYESAAYEVMEKDGKFEIRQYEELTVVSSVMSGEKRNGSFGKLFQYISGSNQSDQKIAMTTPVFMPADSNGKTQEMQFVVPKTVASDGAPTPKDRSVRLKSMSGGKYAVLRYSGQNTSEAQKKMLKKLRGFLTQKKLKPTGSPIFAGYDPPWTPGPMRRNEVLLPLD